MKATSVYFGFGNVVGGFGLRSKNAADVAEWVLLPARIATDVVGRFELKRVRAPDHAGHDFLLRLNSGDNLEQTRTPDDSDRYFLEQNIATDDAGHLFWEQKIAADEGSHHFLEQKKAPDEGGRGLEQENHQTRHQPFR